MAVRKGYIIGLANRVERAVAKRKIDFPHIKEVALLFDFDDVDLVVTEMESRGYTTEVGEPAYDGVTSVCFIWE